MAFYNADYNDDVNVGNTSAQEVGDAIYRQTYYTTGAPYNHTGVYYKLLGETHRIIHVNTDFWDVVTYKHVVREDSFDNFKRSTFEYLGAYSSNFSLTAEQRENIISTLEQLRDRSAIYYTCWNQVDGAGVGSWEGTIDDIDNLRCDGLVEIVYEMNGIDVWGKNQDHYSIVDYPDEHNLVPFSVLDVGCDGNTCPEPDPKIEVLPVVQRGGYGDEYTKLRASVPEPPDIIIDSPLEGAKKTGLFRVTALPEDESGILHVIFEYSADHVNWYPLPGPDSETGKDVYEADGWGLRFDTVGAGIEDSQVWVRANATDKAGNTSDWTETYYFVNNVSIAVSIMFAPSSPTAGSPVTVSGHAEYQDGQSVQNGSVGIITSSGTWTTTTDSYGDYSREITAPGGSSYVYVTVSHDNYLGAAAEWLWISGGSHVSGTLTNDTTWTTGGSPYIVTGSISIPEGVTLTINPGVTVKFTEIYCSLYVSGSLVADGTSDEPIVFTSNQAEPAAEQWGGIRFNEGSSGVMDYCVVEYGGSTFNDYTGIYTVNSSPVITNCTIRNNYNYGVKVEGASEPTITGCTISGHYYPIYTDINCISKIESNTFSDNAHDYMSITTSDLSGDITLKKAATPHLLLGSLSVPQDITLTVEPGVTVKFTEIYCSLYVSGSLVADGTSDEPIVFTSNQAEPAAEQWGGIRFNEGSSGVMDYCVVEYGGSTFNDYTGIYTVNSSPVITNCTIRNNYNYGVKVEGASEPTITGCTISGHYYPIYTDINCISKIESNTFSDNAHDYMSITTSDLSGDITLKKAATPHLLLGSLSVPQDITLTVEPGVTVKFTEIYCSLYVSGSLVADGTSDEPIVFTSNQAEPAAEQWGGIRFNEGSSGVMDYCVVEYGGSTFNDYTGIYTVNSSPVITNCTIRNNYNYGVKVEGASEPTITGCTISGHYYPIYTDINCISKIESNTFSDNAHDYMSITTSDLSGDITLKKAATPHLLLGSLSVPQDITLTVEPGVTVKFTEIYCSLYVSGSLVADGTSDEPIVFTSNQAEPAAEQWGGIRFNEGSSGVMDYCVVEYGGSTFNDYTGIYTVNSSPVITNCTIRNNYNYGVKVEGASEPTITGCTITNHTTGIYSSSSVSFSANNCVISGNSSYGIHNAITTTSINAENCDWGHISGPLDPSDDRATGGLYNPEGQGDKVSDYVDYYPWTGTTIGVTAVPSELSSTPGNGAINLQWNANTETYLGGYKIYCGTTPGSYGTPIVLGKVTSHKLMGLTNGTPYYIAISSMNSVGAESDKCAEITQTPIDDQDAPTSTITQPTDGEEISGETYTITGTADDADGTGVQKVEISTDGGESWNPATGNTSWSYVWILPEAGIYNIKSRATDNAENIETPGDGVTVTVIEIQAPTATTGSATSVTPTSATLNGTVNPNGAETEVVFEWGEDDTYGNEVTATQSPLTGVTEQAVNAGLSELTPGRSYHFRVKATNSEGTTYGVDESFNTPGADISLQKSVDNSRPDVGDDVVFTITVTNNGPDDSTGIEVTDQLPSGLAYAGDDSGGFYDSETGIWDVGDLAEGESATLHITATVEQRGQITNIATRTASSPQDPNPGNDEDDAILKAGGKSMPWLLLLLGD